MPIKNYKIAAVVILYNPIEEVLPNILACTEQTELVYVFDNSEKINQELIKKIVNIERVEYHNNNGNKGVAYALNKGARLAIENQFDFLLTMDQDSHITSGLIEKMIKNCSGIDKLGIISPLHRNK